MNGEGKVAGASTTEDDGDGEEEEEEEEEDEDEADKAEVQAQAEAYKECGNECFRQKDYKEAVAFYTKAIDLDPESSIYCCNRSSALAALGQWSESAKDAQQSIMLSASTKGFFRLAKALMELEQFDQALAAISKGLRLDKNCVELRKLGKLVSERKEKLMAEITTCKDPRRRPTANELQTVRELGHGNFSRILEVVHKPTGEAFALKTIEKIQVERVKKRHPNVNNEILMERRALTKLKPHPNIIDLYHTFQDYSCLYLLMELCTGGELWDRLQLEGNSVGLCPSMAVFFASEVVAALTYIHSKGIVHRDIKPENMVITSRGRLKLIDFGSAKDLIETDLNGPEFVGTPEYMSPEAISSKEALMETDLWALGCCIYQFLTGVTPFKAPSTYLILVRAKRANPVYPAVLSPEAKDLIQRLLQKSPQDRLGSSRSAEGYSALTSHPFFKAPEATFGGAIARIPRLRDLCIRAAAVYAIKLAMSPASSQETSECFRVLESHDRTSIMHHLDCRGRLSEPRVLRIFYPTAPLLHTHRADPHTHEHLGMGYAAQGTYRAPFFMMHLGGPDLGCAAALYEDDGRGGSSWDVELDLFRRALSVVNRLRPQAVVISGPFVAAVPGQAMYPEQMKAFLAALGRLSDSIRAVFVPPPPPPRTAKGGDPHDPTVDFWPEYGAFWCGGVRGVLINSQAMAQGDPQQEKWLKGQLELGRLSANHVMVFTSNPWSLAHKESSGQEEEEGTTQSTTTATGGMASLTPAFQAPWLKRMQANGSKVRLFMASSSTRSVAASVEKLTDEKLLSLGLDALTLADADKDSDSDEERRKSGKKRERDDATETGDGAKEEDGDNDEAEERNTSDEEEDDDEPVKHVETCSSSSCQGQPAMISLIRVYREHVEHDFLSLEADIPTTIELVEEEAID